jgi:heme exporter protein B
MNIYLSTLVRELKISIRNPSGLINPLLFFIVTTSLFPLSISPEAKILSEIAPGIIWVAAMLSVLLSLNTIFHYDFDNGILEQLSISHHSTALVILIKSFSHWILTGLPIVLLSPLMGLFLFLNENSIQVLMLTLLIGTPSLSLIGTIGASLIVGIRSAGMLLALLILPLYIPILIFASSAISQFQAGFEITGQILWLIVILLFSLMLSPFISAAALKINLD